MGKDGYELGESPTANKITRSSAVDKEAFLQNIYLLFLGLATEVAFQGKKKKGEGNLLRGAAKGLR